LFSEEESRFLNGEEFQLAFERSWESLKSQFFKLESRQSYEEPGDPSFEAFLRGDHAVACNLVVQRMQEQAPLYEDVRTKGIRWVRVRIVQLPLSDYIAQYEFAAYRESSRLGEEIRFVDEESLSRRLREKGLIDYLEFDDSVVLVHNYDDQGLQHGGWIIEAPDAIERIQAVSRDLLDCSVSMEAFESAHFSA